MNALISYVPGDNAVIAMIATRDLKASWVKLYPDKAAAAREALRCNILSERAAEVLATAPLTEPVGTAFDIASPKLLMAYGWLPHLDPMRADC